MVPYWVTALVCKIKGHDYTDWYRVEIMLPGWKVRSCKRCLMGYETKHE